MNISFQKFQGTGNDFVMIDNRLDIFPKENQQLIAQLCNRRFGIGADGLILLENDTDTDFRMIYFNADGNQSSMCGNGGRCLVAFAKKLEIIKNRTNFIAIDGKHFAAIDQNNMVSLQMIDVTTIKLEDDYSFLNTGSPHHVTMVDNLAHFDVKKNGANIRYSNLYGKAGSNVNFVKKINDDSFALRTYERGVEDETLACGTGATAAAIAMHATNQTTATHINLSVEGGELSVSFEKKTSIYCNVFLNGPATFVFEGIIEI